MTDKLEELSQPVAWPNGCNETAVNALRYLAEKTRPIGGSSTFNTEHLYMIASEVERMSSQPLYSQEYVTALIERAVAAELREKDTSARAAQADLWAKALVELDEKMKEAARILKSGERLALSRAIKILEGQSDD